MSVDWAALDSIRAQAACRDHPHPEWWWVEPDDPRHQTARQVCASCPVQADCLAWAVAHGERHGLWGGVWMPERQDRRRRR